jgi:ADP-heptose:LPS heptosyltransferase
MNDFSDTAALIENLDLVISVDTSTAHLAGAMGKPVWIMLRYDLDWRWSIDQTKSPWYPTARLFRQPEPGAWLPVVDEIRKESIEYFAL